MHEFQPNRIYFSKKFTKKLLTEFDKNSLVSQLVGGKKVRLLRIYLFGRHFEDFWDLNQQKGSFSQARNFKDFKLFLVYLFFSVSFQT